MSTLPSIPKNVKVHIIGAGLAGSEAAFFLAERGVSVIIHEMRPVKMTDAHQTEGFAELVCSNSLKSTSPTSAPGMMKAEMHQVGSLILRVAQKHAVPSGESLGVDRDLFSAEITQTLREHSHVTVIQEEVVDPTSFLRDDDLSIALVATGPLTSDGLSEWLGKATDTPSDLYFYDAIAPIIDASTVDRQKSFIANRYGKGEEEAYLNCPMNEAEYDAFIDALLAAEKVKPKKFETEKFFQGCQPIEAIASTGRESLRFGPMKPVGLEDPLTGTRAHAVVQLRPENRSRTAYNLVGFQTKLKYGEQSRVFKMIPALKNVEFLRLGSIHRNTYLCAPRVLRSDLSLKKFPRVYVAGQVSGVEGYLESSACGLLAAIFILQRITQLPHSAPPANTALGALLSYITRSDPKNYQPGNIHFGLFDPHFFSGVAGKPRDEGRALMSRQALQNFSQWWNNQVIHHGEVLKK